MIDENSKYFAIIPLEITADHRLTLIQTRVLIALYSFASPHSNTVWPSRKKLAERCGEYEPRTITQATTDLQKLGWLTKIGDGAFGSAARYTITPPNYATPTDRPHHRGGDGVDHPRGMGSIRDKEHTKEHNKNIIRKPKIIESDEDIHLAEYFYALLRKLKPDLAKPNINTWASDIRKMRTIDNRTPEDIKLIMGWMNQDTFWQATILSPAKLRKHFDRLQIQQRKRVTPQPPSEPELSMENVV